MKTISRKTDLKGFKKLMFSFSCKGLKTFFLEIKNNNLSNKLILAILLISNTVFELILLMITSLTLMSYNKICFMISMAVNWTTYFSMIIIIMKERKLSQSRSSAIAANIHFTGIVVTGLEKALAVQSVNELAGYCDILFCLTFLVVLDINFSWDLSENKVLQLLNILAMTIYVLTRSLYALELKYIILLVYVLIKLTKLKFDSNKKVFKPCGSLKKFDEIIETKVMDASHGNEILKFSGQRDSQLESSKKIDVTFGERSGNNLRISIPITERLLQITGDGILIFRANEESPIYLNLCAEKLLGSDPQEIWDSFRFEFYIVPLIKQDEKVSPVRQEFSFVTNSKTHLNSTYLMHHPESSKTEKSATSQASYNNLINESLGSVIEKIKKKIISEKAKTSSQNNSLDLEEIEKRKNDQKPFKHHPQPFAAFACKEVISRTNLLVERRNDPKSIDVSDHFKGRSLEVELTFFEDFEGESVMESSHLYYIVKLRNLDGLGIIEQLQKEIDSFKAQFISSLSHELKTPLNCTINMLELLEFDLNKDLETNLIHLNKLRPALQNSRLLVSNINDVIDYSELVSNRFTLHPARFSLRKLLDDLVELVSTAVEERGNQIHLEYDKNIEEFIISDEERLSQVLLNLLSNANKFTINGHITLKVRSYHDRYIKIVVKDTGSGIKKAELKKIGILAASKNRKLIGLGLTIANYIASVLSPPEKRGIFVRSYAGRGSSFSFFVDNLRQDKLKRSKTAKKVKATTEIFEEITLTELFNFQKNPLDKKECSSQVESLYEEGSNASKEEDSQYFFDMESMDTKNNNISGMLKKNLELLDDLNKARKFFDQIDHPAQNQGKSSPTNKNSSLTDGRALSSGKQLSVHELTSFPRLFPIPQPLNLLLNSHPRCSFYEDDNEKSKKASIIHSIDIDLNALKGSKRPVEPKNNAADFEIFLEEDAQSSNLKLSKGPGNLAELRILMNNRKSCSCPDFLLVDDCGYNLMVLRLMVESLGFKADLARSGDEALVQVKKRLSGTPCSLCRIYYLIFMDLDMPEKDGLETTLEILELFQKTGRKPIIIACTAFHESEFGQKCFSVGMSDFISKPVKRDLLEMVVYNNLRSFL